MMPLRRKVLCTLWAYANHVRAVTISDLAGGGFAIAFARIHAVRCPDSC
jgi:hypothetical protein